MKDTIRAIYTIIGVGFTLFAIAYLAMLGIFFLTWLGGII